MGTGWNGTIGSFRGNRPGIGEFRGYAAKVGLESPFSGQKRRSKLEVGAFVGLLVNLIKHLAWFDRKYSASPSCKNR